MKNTIFASARNLFALAVLSAAAFAPAQTPTGALVAKAVNVPFAFDFGHAHFAPGVYTILNPGDHLMLLRGPSRSAFSISSWQQERSPAAKGAAVFDKVGERYFLREVRIAGDNAYLRNVESREEQMARKAERLSASASSPSTVEVAVADSK